MAVRVSTILSIAVIVGIIVAGVYFFAPRFQTGTTGEPDFIILVNPPNPSIARQESDNVTVEVRSLNNFNSRVTLSLNPPQTPPTNVTAQLERTSLIAVPNLPVFTSAAFHVGREATVGVYNYTVTGEGAGITKSTVISLEVVLNPAIITVEPREKTVSVGEQFTVNVTISDIVDMYGWQFILTYDSSLLENATVSLTLGPTWQAKVDAGAAAHFGGYVQPGRIESSLTLFDPEPAFSGNTTIVMIEFHALTPSTKTVLHFDTENTLVAKFVGGDAQLIKIRIIDGNLTILPSSPASSSSPIQGAVSQGPLFQTSGALVRPSKDPSESV